MLREWQFEIVFCTYKNSPPYTASVGLIIGSMSLASDDIRDVMCNNILTCFCMFLFFGCPFLMSSMYIKAVKSINCADEFPVYIQGLHNVYH